MLLSSTRLWSARAQKQVCTGASAARKQSTRRGQSTVAMALNYPEPIVINAKEKATASLIFLHGLGDTGDGWSDVSYQFQERLPHVRMIFPTAPRRSITLNWGMQMTGWYDIASLDGINRQEDEEGLRESQRYVEGLVAAEVAKGVPAHRIAVGGFSQGGAVALMMLRSKTKLGAVLGLSTYLPLSGDEVVLSEENKATPTLMCHGDADNVVAYEFGRASFSKLTQLGADIEFIPYAGMAHSACASELNDIQDFLLKNLPKQ